MADAPLLVTNEVEAWEKLEDGPQAGSSLKSSATMAQLVATSPSNVLSFVRDSGVRRLGSIRVRVRGSLQACLMPTLHPSSSSGFGRTYPCVCA